MYSLGNVFFSLLTGTLVWEDTEVRERTSRIIEGINLPIPDYVNESASTRIIANIIVDCWTRNAEERPSIFDVVNYLEEAVASQQKNVIDSIRQVDSGGRIPIVHPT